MLSARIQRDIWRQTGIYSTVVMSNANPLLAKLALDNEAKHTPTMRANWSYQDVEEKVWAIPKMMDFWGIGRRMEKRLHALGIFPSENWPPVIQTSYRRIWVRLACVCGSC